MRTSSLITTLNPTAETTNPVRLIQSLALIVTGSSARIIEKGRATFTLLPCDTSVCAGRDLRARAVPLPSAIPGPPISETDSAARTKRRAVRATAETSVSGVVRKRYLRPQPRRQRRQPLTPVWRQRPMLPQGNEHRSTCPLRLAMSFLKADFAEREYRDTLIGELSFDLSGDDGRWLILVICGMGA